MNFDHKELQLIMFICMFRKIQIGIDECEAEGTGDLYRKAASLLRDYTNE